MSARPIHPTSSACADAGFTLVEVLVSMLVFSLISVGALIALSTTLDAREAAQSRIEAVERLAAMRRVMADDFAAMTDRESRDGLGGFIDPGRQLVRPGTVSLTRRARPNPDGALARGDLLRVFWRVESGQLIRSFLPHENPASVADPVDRIVLDGVRAMQVEPLFRDDGRPPRLPSATVDLGRADAVSVTLIHADGETTRHVFEVTRA
ncbi:MAG: GspJ family type II secretion system protein [Pseudomonadota bacterium]